MAATTHPLLLLLILGIAGAEAGCAGNPAPVLPLPMPRSAAAHEPEPESVRATVRSDMRQVGVELAGTALREVPPRSAGQWGYLAGLAALSASLEARKESLRGDVRRSDVFADSGWTEIGGRLGLSRNLEAAAAALYLGGLAADSPRTRETGLLLGESLLVSQTGTGLLNYVVSEERPEAGGQLRYLHRGGSSVSIHATNTTALARVLDHQLLAGVAGHRTVKVLARIGLYAIPAVTDWQRLRSDQHYLWNVVLGSGSSLYLTNALLREHDQQAEGVGERAEWTVTAAPTRGRGGELRLAWSF